MKKILDIFFRKGHKKNGRDVLSVERESQRAFERYQKTYKDLARYDRGEKILTNEALL